MWIHWSFFCKNLNQRSLTPTWPLTPCLLRSHVWLYPKIIVSKSHDNTSMYVDTEINFANYHIEALHVTYYTVNMADCSSLPKEVWLQPIITVCPQYNKCSGIKSVNNSILLNRLHTAMITVLNTGSNLLFGVNRWKGAGPLYIQTHTTYILRTYYVQNEWSHSLLLNSVQARQKGLFLTYFSHFLVTREKLQEFLQHISHSHTCTFAHPIGFFALPIFWGKKIQIQIYQIWFLFGMIPGVDSYSRHFGTINK